MQATSTEGRYGSVAITFHWITAMLIVLAVLFIWGVMLTPKGPLHTNLLVIHRSLGTTILAVAVARLAWRLTHRAPPSPASIPAWQQWAANATHWLLYALLFVMPLSGYTSSAADQHVVSFFYLFDLPQLVPTNHALADAADVVHGTLQWVVYLLISMHAGAALHHHFIVKDNVLRRMLPTPLSSQARLPQ